jgi:hypothetical protein
MASLPQDTKFALGYIHPSGGHVVNAKIGTFGLYFTDNQATFFSMRRSLFLTPPSNARNFMVWTMYDPRW